MSGRRRIALYLNGTKAVATEVAPTDSWPDPDVPGRAIELFHLPPVDIQLMIQLDPEAVSAIHARGSYGFSHLRAMLDALPRCQVLSCKDPATEHVHMGAPPPGMPADADVCDDHLAKLKGDGYSLGRFVDARGATLRGPAVRHLAAYVRDWATNRDARAVALSAEAPLPGYPDELPATPTAKPEAKPDTLTLSFNHQVLVGPAETRSELLKMVGDYLESGDHAMVAPTLAPGQVIIEMAVGSVTKQHYASLRWWHDHDKPSAT